MSRNENGTSAAYKQSPKMNEFVRIVDYLKEATEKLKAEMVKRDWRRDLIKIVQTLKLLHHLKSEMDKTAWKPGIMDLIKIVADLKEMYVYLRAELAKRDSEITEFENENSIPAPFFLFDIELNENSEDITVEKESKSEEALVVDTIHIDAEGNMEKVEKKSKESTYL